MISILPKNPFPMDPEAKTKLMELLTDPVRARIFFEALLHREVTAEYLMRQLTISRSTLSHHLSKLVETRVLDTRVESVGRQVKYYYLSKEFEHPAKDEPETVDDDWVKQRILWTEQTYVSLQAITNVVATGLKRLKDKHTPGSPIDVKSDEYLTIHESSPKCFTFHCTNEEGANIWFNKYVKFLEDFEAEFLKLEGPAKERGDKFQYVLFSGLVPMTTYHSLKDSPNND